MGQISKKEIIEKMEKLGEGESLRFMLSPTFGSRTVVLERNPLHAQKGQKKYALLMGKDEAHARREKPFMTSDKAKKLAEWVAERYPEWLDQPPSE